MRTPGHDFELAAGFLFDEAVLDDPAKIRDISYCRSEGPQEYNVLSVRLRASVSFDPQLLAVTLDYEARDGQTYQLNFIDTPGHVDFSYEVSRSLAACEGALLIVDASQGVEAQSVANCYTAIDQGLEVIPVLNKIDLPAADPDRVCKEIEEVIGIDASNALRVSAKTGEGIHELLEQIVADRTMVAGMHVPFPGIGHIEAAATGYRFIPAAWQYF